MREIRPSGSEGGVADNGHPYPYSDDLGQGGLTGSGRSEEDEGLDAVGINGATEQ